MQVGPLGDRPCLTPPPPTSHWIATTRRHTAAKRSGRERRGKWVRDTHAADTRWRNETPRHVGSAAGGRHAHAAALQGGVQVPTGHATSVRRETPLSKATQ